MRDIIGSLIADFHERPLPKVSRRDAHVRWVPGKAHVVMGMRRVGKTWLCYQAMQDLLARGVDKSRLLYLNFEDERLDPFRTTDFQTILDEFYRRRPSLKAETCYLFFDEIHRVPGWSRFVRRLIDSENVLVCVTGSSAKLLSSEIATELRGRSLETEVFPLGFEEFLRFHQIDVPTTGPIGSRVRATLQHAAERFLHFGGFPEVQHMDNELRIQVLQNYVDVVILRDVVERHSVKNIPALRALIRHALQSPANKFSVNRLYNDFRSQGLSCTKNDLYGFLDYLQEAFLLFLAPLRARSQRVQRVNPPKVYAVDEGLLEAFASTRPRDHGATLENLVFRSLRRLGAQCSYVNTREGFEVDFFVTPLKPGQPSQLIQACWKLDSKDTRERELRALMAAMKETGIKRGTIVTWLDQEHLNGHVQIIPAWKWLLNPLKFA